MEREPDAPRATPGLDRVREAMTDRDSSATEGADPPSAPAAEPAEGADPPSAPAGEPAPGPEEPRPQPEADPHAPLSHPADRPDPDAGDEDPYDRGPEDQGPADEDLDGPAGPADPDRPAA